MRTLIPTLLAAALSACAVGPNYRAPVPAPAVLPSASAAGITRETPATLWWTRFDDPVLAGLIAEALVANPDLRVGIARVNQARAVFGESRLDQLPHVTLGAADARGTRPRAEAGGARESGESASAGFDASWELDLFGRKRRATEAARADVQAGEAELADLQVSLAAEMARDYFALRRAQRGLDIARQTLANADRSQRTIEARRQLGAATAQEEQSGRAYLHSVEAAVPEREIDEAQARRRIEMLAGHRPGELDALLAPAPAVPLLEALPVGDVAEVLRQRPDVRAAERRLAAATARIGVAEADLFPRISLSGFIGFVAGDVGGLLDADHKAWSTTPSLSWSALDLGSAHARLRGARAAEDAVLAGYEKTVLAALEETENALHAYDRRRQRLLQVAAQADAARRSADLAGVRYREGADDVLTLLEAQRGRLAADDALAAAQYDVNAGVVAVYKALGGWNGAGARREDGEGMAAR